MRLILLALMAAALSAATTDSDFSITVPGTCWYVAVTGDDAASGSRTAPFRTIGKGAAMAQPGDAVLVNPGLYRERVTPPRGGSDADRPIVYKARPGQWTVIRGSEAWRPAWQNEGGTTRSAIPDVAMFNDPGYVDGEVNPFRVASSAVPYGMEYRIRLSAAQRSGTYTCGQVFVNGAPYMQTPNQAALADGTGRWWYDRTSGRIHVRFTTGVDPATATVEISTRRRILAPHLRGLGHIQVIGFIMEHCANQYPYDFWSTAANTQSGAVSTRSGRNWVVRDNLIRYANGIGLDVGSEGLLDVEVPAQPVQYQANVGHHLIERNRVTDNGATGIMAYLTTNLVLRGNVIERNNALLFDFYDGYFEHAGIKLHASIGALLDGNLVRDNRTFGIYIDGGGSYQGLRMTRNIVVGNDEGGFHVEAGTYDAEAVVIDNNVICNNRSTGIYISDTSGITLAHNLIANTFTDPPGGERLDYLGDGAGVFIRSSGADRVGAHTRHMDIRNCIFLGNRMQVDVNYPYSPYATGRLFSHNLYMGEASTRTWRLNPDGRSRASGETVNQWLDDFINHVVTDLRTAPGFGAVTAAALQSDGQRYRALLSFAEWQAFWGVGGNATRADSGSRLTAAGVVSISSDARTLSITGLSLAPSVVGSLGHPVMDTDLTGAAVARDGTARPGPVQSLAAGTSTTALWQGVASLAAGAMPPAAPTISAIGPQLISMSASTGALAFTVADLDTPAADLQVAATSSDTTLVPSSGFIFAGSGANRTVTVTPAPGAAGSTYITVAVSDGVRHVVTVFALEVMALSDHIQINFQPSQAPTVLGWLVDGGQTFARRSNGLSYGWDRDLTDAVRDRNEVDDQRLDTLIILGNAGSNAPSWSIALENGTYEVTVTCGDHGFSTGRQAVTAQGIVVVDAVIQSQPVVSGTATVEVTDGRLRIRVANAGTDVKLISLVIDLLGGGSG